MSKLYLLVLLVLINYYNAGAREITSLLKRGHNIREPRELDLSEIDRVLDQLLGEVEVNLVGETEGTLKLAENTLDNVLLQGQGLSLPVDGSTVDVLRNPVPGVYKEIIGILMNYPDVLVQDVMNTVRLVVWILTGRSVEDLGLVIKL